jgi:NADPH:quinone reductase-like Zn-dependent oxidoreductase
MAISKQWVLPSPTGIDALQLSESVTPTDLGDDEVAVDLYAASLNYRELVIIKVQTLAKLNMSQDYR